MTELRDPPVLGRSRNRKEHHPNWRAWIAWCALNGHDPEQWGPGFAPWTNYPGGWSYRMASPASTERGRSRKLLTPQYL